MRRLRDLQDVELHFGTRCLHGQVLAIEGDTAVLGGDAGLRAPTGLVGRACRLVFTAQNALVALHGTVEDGPLAGTARFRVADAAHVPQPRAASRLALPLAATVRRTGSSPSAGVRCRIADVSAGGLGLRGWTAAVGTRVTVSTTLPGSDRVLELEARVARCFPDGAGLGFVGETTAGEAISRLVVAYRATVVSSRGRSPRRSLP